MEGAHRVRGFVLGSWTRLLIAAGIILALWAVFIGLAISGRLGELRYLNVPLLHPYPPAGYVQNPWNTGDKGDLISRGEAERVKTDLARDGQIELQALERGNPAAHADADTGRASASLSALIAKNNSAGVIERETVHVAEIVVGRSADPNDQSITWLVQERGSATIADYSKSTNSLVRKQSINFLARYWLQRVGGRYLIADVLITPQTGGNQ
jgi:hypothetical protein